MRTTFIQFDARGEVSVGSESIAVDALAPLEVVVQNEVSLVSAGTELARLHGLESDVSFPFRPGYACIGRVLDKGSGVDDFAPGERVFYTGKHASAQRFQHGQGHQWGRLYPVPDTIAPEEAVFVALAEIAFTAPAVTELDLGDTVAVFGLGLVGNMAAQLYQILGARVVAIDPIQSRCDLARRVGLQNVICAAPDEQVTMVRELTGGRGAAVAVDAVGHSSVIANAIAATAKLGQVVLLGTPRAPHQTDATALWNAVHTHGLTVRGAHMWRWPAAEVPLVKKTVPWGHQMLLDLIASGRLQVALLRSHLARPAEAPLIYDGLQNKREQFWGAVFDWREQ